MKKILITGTKGFLGKNIAAYYKKFGYMIYGIGHGKLNTDECKSIGLDFWLESDITIEALRSIEQDFDLIIHCGGSGSVGFSIDHPYEDFKKTVNGTLEILEFMRLYNSNAQLIYPSSPAVQGEHPDRPIHEDYIGKPTSPYGYHKKISEDLCRSYSEKYGLTVKIIRLFSVYGNGLKKQLLWDACQKLTSGNDNVEFWGSGYETRDFIHIHDVLTLLDCIFATNEQFMIINGGSGVKHTIAEVIALIQKHMYSTTHISFNAQVNAGNPIYYWADTTKLESLNWKSSIPLEEGVKSYVQWVKNQ